MKDAQTANSDKEFVFLCVVDKSPELSRALRFSCQRAKRVGGRVALVHVIQPAEFQHWMAIGDLMQEEAREEAEALLAENSDRVVQATGKTPIIHLLHGDTAEELLKLIDEDKTICLLVLGAATGKEGPGPLVSYFVDKSAGRLHIPVTVVPGNMTDEEIDNIT